MSSWSPRPSAPLAVRYKWRRRQRLESMGFAVFVTLVIVVIVGGIGLALGASSFYHQHTEICTVESKDRTTSAKGGSDMRLYTKECGVVAVGDILLRGQFSTADTYGSIEAGNTYQMTVVGPRIPLLSQFPTILGDVQRVNG